MSNVEDKIRQRAYELWEQNGKADGSEMDFWLQAEREIAEQTLPEPPQDRFEWIIDAPGHCCSLSAFFVANVTGKARHIERRDLSDRNHRQHWPIVAAPPMRTGQEHVMPILLWLVEIPIL